MRGKNKYEASLDKLHKPKNKPKALPIKIDNGGLLLNEEYGTLTFSIGNSSGLSVRVNKATYDAAATGAFTVLINGKLATLIRLVPVC